MATCYCCGRSGANRRRSVSTGSSHGSWSGTRSFGSSSRSYYGVRTVCNVCSDRIDRRKRNGRIVLFLVILLGVGYYLYVKNGF